MSGDLTLPQNSGASTELSQRSYRNATDDRCNVSEHRAKFFQLIKV